jgi:hypothetical protein
MIAAERARLQRRGRRRRALRRAAMLATRQAPQFDVSGRPSARVGRAR